MKRILLSMMMMTIVISSSAMSYSKARSEALFLTDKMAYELGLSPCQYDAAYAINLDYLMSVDSRSAILGSPWSYRNQCLQSVLSRDQYRRLKGVSSFYKPVEWLRDAFYFAIYSRYADRNRYYCHQPSIYVSYKGGRYNSSYYKSRAWYDSSRDKAKIYKEYAKAQNKASRAYAKSKKQEYKSEMRQENRLEKKQEKINNSNKNKNANGKHFGNGKR